MGYSEEKDQMSVMLTLPIGKMTKLHDIAEIQMQALWLLREADKNRKAYPTGKKWQENYENCLKVVTKINEIMMRTKTEISAQIRQNISEELGTFMPF